MSARADHGDGGEAVAFGTFPVRADAASVAAFCAATGAAADGGRLPLTYPMRWLALGAVREAIDTAMPERDLVPFHEGQSFDYVAPLRIDEDYLLTLSTRREASPARMIVAGRVTREDGEHVLSIETVLRLFPLPPSAAP